LTWTSIPGAAAARLLLALAMALIPAAPAARGADPDRDRSRDPISEPASPHPPRLSVVSRSVAQDQGGWVVDYRLRYHGPAGLEAGPSDVLLKVEGWVSNSRVPAHATPRLSSLTVSGPSGLSGVTDVLDSPDDSQRCKERLTARVWAEESGERSEGKAEAGQPPSLNVAPEGMIRVRVKLAHAHVLYGDYDPLLGTRSLELHLGAATFRDELPLDREQYVAQPRYTWPAPPEQRRDTDHFLSAPDSLHLAAHVEGGSAYRFPERPVRYATPMRLSFWYYIAAGSEGRCLARISQFKDTPTAWKTLSEGAIDEDLTTVGRWVKVERVFRTEPEATTLALDFRIVGDSYVGEMWIDDVTLEPADGPSRRADP
jgi:hypothetical protein